MPQSTTPMQTYSGYNAAVAPVMLVPNVSGRPMPVFVAPHQPQVLAAGAVAAAGPPGAGQPTAADPQLQLQQPPPPTPRNEEEDLKQVKEMFPNIDAEVIKSVYDANRGNKDTTINSLLQITND